jgi:hypothetical protein
VQPQPAAPPGAQTTLANNSSRCYDLHE